MQSQEAGCWLTHQLEQIEAALQAFLPSVPQTPHPLGQGMRYAVLNGGKRIRPLLVLAARRAVAGNDCDAAQGVFLDRAAMRAACATEIMHAYSLVHDDMPCMDNDILRRGKPTVHVQYGESSALLIGDALQALAFELLTPDGEDIPPATQATLCRLLARASGYAGMAGGQAIDLGSVDKKLDQNDLRHMHQLKTGALLQACVMMGAACGNISTADEAALQRYGCALGLVFQVVDDILDVTADSATLGKTPGKDVLNNKPTYVSVLGLAQSRRYAAELLQQAQQALDESSLVDTAALSLLVHQIVHRSS